MSTPVMAHVVCAHPLRQEVLTAADDGTLAQWSLDADGPVLVTSAMGTHNPQGSFAVPVVAPDGAAFAVAGSSATIEVRDWESLRVLRFIALLPSRWREEEPEATALAYAPNGRWLAVADSQSRIYLLHYPTGQAQVPMEGGERDGCLTFDRTSHLLASGLSFQGGTVLRIDRVEENGYLTPLHEWEDDADTLCDVALSPQAHWLAAFVSMFGGNTAHFSPGWRGAVLLYSLKTGRLHDTVIVDATLTGDYRSQHSLWVQGHNLGFGNLLWLDDDHALWGSTGGILPTYRVSERRIVRRVEVATDAAVAWLARDASGLIWAVLEGGQIITIPSNDML